MLKKFLKNENGSITLFVLLAILFFLIVIFSIFMVSGNKKQAQTSEIDKIKKEYEQSIDNIDQIYDETLTENLSNLLKVGDYVNYAYDTVTNGYSLPAIESGSNTDQTIMQTTGLKWRILSINEDGTVDLISETPTKQQVSFRGALGYNNGVLLMNNICAEQYSNKKLGITARNINLEDIESQMNEAGIAARERYMNSESETQYGSTKTYGNGYNQYPNLYEQQNGSGIDTTTTKTDGISENDNGYTSPTTETSSIASKGLTVTQTYYYFSNPRTYFDNSNVYDMLFESQNHYWLASRSSICTSTYADFGLRRVYNSSLGAYSMFFSYGSPSALTFALRPIVTLEINQIQPCSGESADGTDTSIQHMHQIKEIYKSN